VGGLSGDIGELALKLGSSDEAMLNATSSFVTFAQSTGAASDEIVSASGTSTPWPCAPSPSTLHSGTPARSRSA
jgi:hypothetical protein